MAWFRNLKVSGKLLLSFIVVLAVAVGAGAFMLVNIKIIDDSYSQTMDISLYRIETIIEAKDHLAETRLLLRELFYPSTTREDIIQLQDELNVKLDGLTRNLSDLSESASVSTSEEIGAILVMIGDYRKDIDVIFTRLLNSGTISPDNPDFRTAQLRAEQLMKDINQNYGDDMMQRINNLTDIAMAVVRDLSVANKARVEQILVIVIIVFAALVVIGLLIAFYVSKLISKPLVMVASFMKRAGATGDITLLAKDIENVDNAEHSKDEIGQVVTDSVSFVHHVSNIAEELGKVAKGDLTAEIVPLSEKDVMGQSLKYMIDRLNYMFEEIHNATSQATVGSKHVSDGAQALAQNSAEQSASVDALSGSIGDISFKIEENFSIVEKTSKFSATIKENAEKGTYQMDELIAAVNEINEASQSISKIINTINNIAFQTNILALNAAVEAARAGQHGKGFAVVAEEVRSLALRSAAAAKDTGELIQNSIEKAELGSSIAQDTAKSFAEIVSGINESNNLIELITEASEEQLMRITEINKGIDQVLRVVQQNSATAEESAAASEEMNNQTAMLQESMMRFKIKRDTV